MLHHLCKAEKDYAKYKGEGSAVIHRTALQICDFSSPLIPPLEGTSLHQQNSSVERPWGILSLFMIMCEITLSKSALHVTLKSVRACVCVHVCVHVCACMCKRETDRKRQKL